MQYSVTLERDLNSGHVKMETVNHYKNPYRKESNRLVGEFDPQDIKYPNSVSQVGMPTCSLEHSEAVRRYCAAFPSLKKGEESPLLYYLPPPAWCRKSTTEHCQSIIMQSESVNNWNTKNRKFTGKERRNSFHCHKKSNKKRNNSYSRSLESNECLPEWVTHEGVWDIETQDPVKEFIRAIAFDEGYGTCENTVTDEIKEINRMNADMVPDWDDGLDLDGDWFITQQDLVSQKPRSPTDVELYAKFEAKFDRSIEALWQKDQNTPDDEYQDLPIDFQDLLSSPSDRLFADPSTEKCSLLSLTDSIWSNPSDSFPPVSWETTSRIMDGLHESFKPLKLADPEPVLEPVSEPLYLFEGQDVLDAVPMVTENMRSYTAINHSRDCSGFAEVPPKPRRGPPLPLPDPPERDPTPSPPREDLLKSSLTHFRPIRTTEEEAPRYADGDTFDIDGSLDVVEYRRSETGGVYVENSTQRYLEWRLDGRLLRYAVRQTDASAQTIVWGECEECGGSAKKMRPNGIDSIWSAGGGCEACLAPAPPASVPPEELSREWEELLSDISAAHSQYAGGGVAVNADVLEETLVSAERKRRHSAALRGPPGVPTGPPGCTHPHARFLHCCTLDRPLTR